MLKGGVTVVTLLTQSQVDLGWPIITDTVTKCAAENDDVCVVRVMEDDLQRFIHSVESSAKKILKDHTKRVHDEAARERVEKGRPKQPVEVKSISRDELKSKYGPSSLIIPAPKLKEGESTSTAMPQLKQSPRLAIQVHPIEAADHTTTTTSLFPNSGSLPSLATKRHKQDLRDRAASKLINSPLFKGLAKSSSSTTSFKAALAQLNAVDDLRILGLGGGKPGPANHRHEHSVERRMCNACWAEPVKHTACEHRYRTANPNDMELQGASSWSIDDLHFKYRAEREREAAWVASTQLQQEAESSPVVPILERHPIYDKFFHTIDNDNTYVKNVSRAKNQTKQFVLDVNRVWLTNLDHFNHMTQDTHDEYLQPPAKRNCLRGRHDLGLIRQGYSQVQSVSMACALKNAKTTLDHHDPVAHTEGAAPSPPPNPQHRTKVKAPTDGIEAEGSPLSVLACGRIDFRGQVPGTVVLATYPGLWWCVSPSSLTRPTAMYLRESKLSSTNSILVHVLLALDSPVLAPTWFAWVPGTVCAPFEKEIATSYYYIPPTCGMVLALPSVVSPLDEYLPSTMCIANGCDQAVPDMPEFNDRNFRQWIRWVTVPPNFDFDAQAYGIVQGYPNQTGLNGRFSWHSDEVVDSHTLIRPRLEADYAVLATNRVVRGGNDPNMYTMNMRHESIDKITTSGLRAFLAAQEKIHEEERLKQQLLEIETKLQAGRLALDAKRAEKRRFESTVAEWAHRVAHSRLVRDWNGWEERELNESKVLFYHHSNPTLTVASQWTPPPEWPPDDDSAAPLPPPSATGDAFDDDDDDDTSTDAAELESARIDNSIQSIAKSLADNETFVDLLREKLGLKSRKASTSRRHSSLKNAPLSPTKSHGDSSDDDDQAPSDDEDTIAGRVLRMLAQDESTQDTNTASVKRLTRLQILKEAPQVHPITLGEGWKRLKPTRLPKTFAKKVYTTTIAGPTASFINQTNLPLILGLLDPSKNATYVQPEAVPDFRHHIIPNLDSEVTAMKKVLAATAKKGRRSTILQVFQDTTADEDEVPPEDEVTEAERIAKAVLYTRNNNIKELENMLDQGVNINARDENGNTLFILACQQGNKNMCKFLMRRRCELDSQNFRGNTGLHYCYEYKWTDLATYLKDKGAKDDIPNAEGLMCYEGISSDNLQKL
ncbi:hypothetical protein DYB28_001184 [Aphanomyces astaci]|uniref:Uncharacterized protein n=1 Tax=Aphanomyces astaci TaxID=112090 RepID=A0A9X8HGL7_APHAT|nr:hypothetical protein DYB28_001184 [Aphanomyces astaci]